MSTKEPCQLNPTCLVGNEHKGDCMTQRDFESCAAGNCGALRYYHNDRPKRHKFKERSGQYHVVYLLWNTATNNESKLITIVRDRRVADRWAETFGNSYEQRNLDDTSEIQWAMTK